MIDILAFLDSHAGALSAVFSAVVMAATVVYAILTAALVRETRRMREVQTEPRIEVIAAPREEFVNIITLVVRNIGAGPAYDIRFDLRGETSSSGEKKLIEDFSNSHFLVQGLKYLGPGQELRSSYTQMNKDFDEKIGARLLINIRYKSALGKPHEETIYIDFGEFKGHGRVGKPHLYAIATSLEKIEREFNWLVTGFKRLRVDVFSEAERAQERKEMEEFEEEARQELSASDSQQDDPGNGPRP